MSENSFEIFDEMEEFFQNIKNDSFEIFKEKVLQRKDLTCEKIKENQKIIKMFRNTPEKMKFLHSIGFNLHAGDFLSPNMLFFNSCKESIEYLVENGVNVKEKNKTQERSAIFSMISLYHDNPERIGEIIDFLLSNGANINECDKEGTSLLQYTVTHSKQYLKEKYNNSIELFLIKRGAIYDKNVIIRNPNAPGKIEINLKDLVAPENLIILEKHKIKECLNKSIVNESVKKRL